MKLDQYLRETGMKDGEFAALVGVDRSTVHRWKEGVLSPDDARTAKIVDVTGGAVTVADLRPLLAPALAPLTGEAA